jgi:hypothetical protein
VWKKRIRVVNNTYGKGGTNITGSWKRGTFIINSRFLAQNSLNQAGSNRGFEFVKEKPGRIEGIRKLFSRSKIVQSE